MLSEEIIGPALDFVIFVLPVFIPVALIVILVNIWVDYARNKFISEQDNILLHIIPPQDIFKTPAAMDLFVESFYQTVGEKNLHEKYWKGSVRPWFSLEMASIGGNVGFYIWTRKNAAGYLSSQLYAQYPGIEVTETEDYTKLVDFESGKYKKWGCEYKLTEADPIPIKTYVDYGLDKSTEEEEKVDPITSTLEFMGSIKPGEFVWLQILVRAHKDEDSDPKKWFGKTDLWKDDAKDLIQEIRQESVVELDKGGETVSMPMATKGQTSKIEAVERSISKTPFDVGIRGLYIAEKDLFDGANIGGLIGSFKQYSSSALNGFKPGVTAATKWWEDPFGTKAKLIEEEIKDAYIERGYFFRDLLGKRRKKFILNSEELATIFHFPGSVAATPSLERTSSKKSEAPGDLPV